MLRDIHGGDESPSEIFRINFYNEEDEVYKPEQLIYESSETLVTIADRDFPVRKTDFIYPTEDSLHIRTNSMRMELVALKIRYDTLNKMGKREFEYISYKKETKYQLLFLDDAFTLEAPWEGVGNRSIVIVCGPTGELYIRNYKVVAPIANILPFEEGRMKVSKEYKDWLDKIPLIDDRYATSREMAAYLLWANMVRREGMLTVPVTYMSKNWMQNIWSWDNCFNAIFLAEHHPELAFNQLKIFMDHQDESGAYPDFVNDKYVSYNCVKPPIHAWAYQQMISKNDCFKQESWLKAAYESFVANTAFWLNYRLHEADGLPYYTHGNDSGWDNASIFQEGLPVTSPDLAAFLIQQMDILSDFAQTLNQKAESILWREQADKLFSKFLPAFYDGQQLVALDTVSGEKIDKKSSAILFLPLVIAYRMEKDLREQLVGHLLERFECRYGIATEEPTSPSFSGAGYWLGSVWAPETYILVKALQRADHEVDALRISEKFCEATIIGGMAENFDPNNGTGNDDLAFAWTSSVFLLLAKMIQDRGEAHE
jgi:glycogen debranching enzyme